MTQKIGLVQLLTIGFGPDARFEGKIMDELAALERHETIRLLSENTGGSAGASMSAQGRHQAKKEWTT